MCHIPHGHDVDEVLEDHDPGLLLHHQLPDVAGHGPDEAPVHCDHHFVLVLAIHQPHPGLEDTHQVLETLDSNPRQRNVVAVCLEVLGPKVT